MIKIKNFSGLLLFTGMALLNWLKRSAKSLGGFKIKELFEMFDSLLILLMKPRNFWFFKLPNGKRIVVQDRNFKSKIQ